MSGVVIALALVQAPARADDVSPLFELVDAATQRLQTAEPVSASKWRNGGSIEDPQRVEQVLAAVGADATGKGVDAEYVRRIFTDQVHATEAIESPGLRSGNSIRDPRLVSHPTWRRHARSSTA